MRTKAHFLKNSKVYSINILNQVNFSLPSSNLYEHSQNTKKLATQEEQNPPISLPHFFRTARNIASYPNTPPKIGAKYHYEECICELMGRFL